MSITSDDVLEILKFIDESFNGEMHLEMGDLKLTIRKGGEIKSSSELELNTTVIPESIKPEQLVLQEKIKEVTTLAPSQLEKQRTEPISVYFKEEELIPIKSPLLGVFYVAPKPGAPPFVEINSIVNENDTLCLIEVMKTFDTVKSPIRGHVIKICAENTKLVEYQQTLFLIKPEESSEGNLNTQKEMQNR